MRDFARGFRLLAEDGEQYDGAEYPSGLVVTTHPEGGLGYAAISLDALLQDHPGARIEWAKEED